MPELPFLDDPDTAEARRIVLGEIARVQALVASGVQTFDWWGTPHWVDRERMLVMHLDEVAAYADRTTLPDGPETAEILSGYAGELLYVDVVSTVDLFGWLVAGTLARHTKYPSATGVLNLFMVQPLVNPAFGPLSWVVLSHALADVEGPDNLMEIVGPMTYDMSRYPASRADAPAVRRAQADFYRARTEGELPSDWETLDDAAWAAACAGLLARWRNAVDMNVFQRVTDHADAIRRGARDA